MLTKEEQVLLTVAYNEHTPVSVIITISKLGNKLPNKEVIKKLLEKIQELEKEAKELGLEFTYEALVSSGESIARISKRLDTLKLYFDHPDYEFDDKQNKLLDSALPGYEGKSYRDLANMMTADSNFLDFKADILKSHKDVLLAQIKNGYESVVKHADLSLKKDPKFMLAAAKIDTNVLYRADESLKKNFDFMLRLAKEIGIDAVDICADKSLHEPLLNNEEIALLVVKQDGLLLETTLPAKHRNDPKIVLAAIAQNKKAAAYIAEVFARNSEFMLDAAKINIYALKYADQSLKKDPKFMLDAVKIDFNALKYADQSLKKDREFMLDAAKINIYALKYADDSLKMDREFMLYAAKIDFNALRYADQSLREDFDFMLRLAKEIGIDAVDIYADYSLWERLLDNEEIALLVVKKNGLLLKHLPEKYSNDPKIVFAAVAQNKEAAAYIGAVFKAENCTSDPYSTALPVLDSKQQDKLNTKGLGLT